MKALSTLLAISILLISNANAKIINHEDSFYVETKNGEIPLFSVNQMIKGEKISKIKLYDNGSIHLISFAINKDPVKLYSVDEKGFTYAIYPFSSYSVSTVQENGKFLFNEVPRRKFYVDSNGFFLY